MVHILCESDVWLSLVLQCCFPPFFGQQLPPALRLLLQGCVMEVKVCFRNHTYTNSTWINSQAVIKKTQLCPKMHFYSSGFGEESSDCERVAALLGAKWQGGGAGWQGLFETWVGNERRAGLALENKPLIPYSHDTRKTSQPVETTNSPHFSDETISLNEYYLFLMR